MQELLPDDMVAEVLGRLPASSLAAARCVCKRWCSIVDGRRLLRALLLPLRLAGIFYADDLRNPHEAVSYFFARPPTARHITCDFYNVFLDNNGGPNVDRRILHHCNGLLLLGWDMAVVNPATRRWAILPPFPSNQLPPLQLQLPPPSCINGCGCIGDEEMDPSFHLVYDPIAVSPHHFEVFFIPGLTIGYESKYDGQGEWPPSPYTMRVFSSTTWKWEERSFVRQGEPVGTIADIATDDDRPGVYFRGALYVHCQNNSVMRYLRSTSIHTMNYIVLPFLSFYFFYIEYINKKL